MIKYNHCFSSNIYISPPTIGLSVQTAVRDGPISALLKLSI